MVTWGHRKEERIYKLMEDKMNEIEDLQTENQKLKEEAKEHRKWEKIKAWTNIIGCSILLIIILVGILLRIGVL